MEKTEIFKGKARNTSNNALVKTPNLGRGEIKS
jgi:hypothetical protein